MAKTIIWTKIILEEFIDQACLSEIEEMVIRTRTKGWSITKQAQELNMSKSNIS